MAQYEFGPLGPFRGKLGTVVGSSWKGKPNLRSRPKKSTKPVSESKKKAQSALSFISKWLAPINKLVMIGFDSFDPAITGRMAAHSYNATHALKKGSDGFAIDYNKALFSYGNLPAAPDAKAELIDGKNVLLTWDTTCNEGGHSSDIIMYMLYFPEKTEAEYDIGGYCRRDGSMTIKVPNEYKGLRMEVMIAFKSATTSEVSTSRYLGSLSSNPQTTLEAAPVFCSPVSLETFKMRK